MSTLILNGEIRNILSSDFTIVNVCTILVKVSFITTPFDKSDVAKDFLNIYDSPKVDWETKYKS